MRILGLVFAAVALAGCAQGTAATPSDPAAEEYSVYSAVIADVGGQPVVSGTVDGGKSWTESDYDRLHEQIPRVDPDIWNAFNAANGRPEQLEARFDPVLGEVSLANAIDLANLFKNNKPATAWAAFHEKYPGKCLVSLSHVGFNAQMNQALVYLSRACDEKSGGGQIVHLGRQRGKWAVQGRLTLWGK